VKSQVIEKNETGCGPATVNLFSASPVIFARRNARKKLKFYILLEHLPSLAALKSVCSTPAAHRFRVYMRRRMQEIRRERLKKAACERGAELWLLRGGSINFLEYAK
jgi:hypothetical protein